MKHTWRSAVSGQLARALIDFALAMLVIWCLSLGTSVQHGVTFIVFSLTVATIATLDLAFWRHLRRVYTSPRRGMWRRG